MADYRQQQSNKPTTVIVPRQAVVQQPTCCCGVPDNSSSEVKYTRRVSIVIIIIHVVAMLSWWFQFIGNLIGIIMGSIVLCSFKKCTYTTAGFLYVLGFLSDAINAGILITFIFLYDTDGESVDDVLPIGWALLIILPPLLGAISFFFGAVFAFKATGNWERSGAPETLPV